MLTVYSILCLPNGHVHVGSTEWYEKRIEQHLSELRNGRHFNYLLQQHFQLYGQHAFRFRPISHHEGYVDRKRIEHEMLLQIVPHTPVYNALHCLVHPWGERLGKELHPLNIEYQEV